jgi:CheY-like chemotaxis protein
MSLNASVGDNLTIIKKIEQIFSRFIRVKHKVSPSSQLPPKSEYHSIFPEPIIGDAFCDEESLIMSETRNLIQNGIDYNVYMKCFVHELRTPVSTIILGLQVLSKKVKGGEDQQTIKDINKSAVFIENILTKFARVQDGKIELNVFKPFSLQKLITDVEILIMYNFKKSNVTLSYYIDPSVSLWNYGDAHNIKHIIINLLKNAIKYRCVEQENTITIHITKLPNTTRSEQHTVIISIKDQNNHLLPHIKEHLFTTFNSTSGSGLGLYICKNIVELHGGKIAHNFREPIGNEFVIELPFVICYDNALHINTPSSGPASYRKSIHLPSTTYNVLVVDDSILNCKMMYKILKSIPLFNYIYSTENGTAALEIICKDMSIIDIVLMDKNMPVMNGLVAAKAMRAVPYNKLIIGLTGEDSPEDIHCFIDSGADYVIVKPMDNKKLKLLSSFVAKYGTDSQSDKTIQLTNGELEWV